MVHALKRGENVSLADLSPETTRVEIGLGWEVGVAGTGLDADSFAVLVGADGTVPSDAHLVFYNNAQSPDGAVRLSGDLTGGAGEDRQRVALELSGMPPEVERVVLAVAVYGADGREQTLAEVSDLYLRVVDAPADGPLGEELVRFSLDGDLTIENAVVLGEVYRYGEQWKVVAVGQRYASGLRGVATEFGVNV